MPGISRTDIIDADFVDAVELLSDGTVTFLTVNAVSTTSGTQTVVVNLASDGEGIHFGKDHEVSPGDIVVLAGTTGGADGRYIVATVPTDTSFTVTTAIATSTGGTATFYYAAGATNVGFDPTGQTVTSSTTLQGALTDVANNSISATDHETLRQLVHLADGVGGPMDGWPSGSYRETLPLGSPFPTTIIWWTDNTTTKKIVQKTITFNLSHLPTVIAWTVFASDGTTAIATVTDTITYTSTVFEQSRTRTVT